MEILERETQRTSGLLLLPTELLQDIFSRLALPDLLRLRAASRALPLLPPAAATWLFLLNRRSPRHVILRGFDELTRRWFLFPLSPLLPADDLYLLAAAADFFLFASNSRRELLAADLRRGAAFRLPPSPLGPRGTSSWRRPGLKLLPSSPGHFRFLFAETTDVGPTLFEYTSEVNAWKILEPAAAFSAAPYEAVLCATHEADTTFLVAAPPPPLRPADGMRVYGDNHVAVIRSTAETTPRERKVTDIELWEVNFHGGGWEKVAGTPPGFIAAAGGKSFCAMTGCLEVVRETARLVLMANCKGRWDLTWVTFDKGSGAWGFVAVPDGGAKGFNMAGMALTSSLGLWPER